MNLMLAGDLDNRNYVSKFTKGACEHSKSNRVIIKGKGCCNFYKTTLMNSKNSVTSTLDGSIIGV